jgi:hypothetical protein
MPRHDLGVSTWAGSGQNKDFGKIPVFCAKCKHLLFTNPGKLRNWHHTRGQIMQFTLVLESSTTIAVP